MYTVSSVLFRDCEIVYHCVVSFSQQRFIPWEVHVGFVVDIVAPYSFSSSFDLTSFVIMSQISHIHSPVWGRDSGPIEVAGMGASFAHPDIICISRVAVAAAVVAVGVVVVVVVVVMIVMWCGATTVAWGHG